MLIVNNLTHTPFFVNAYAWKIGAIYCPFVHPATPVMFAAAPTGRNNDIKIDKLISIIAKRAKK
jgi:hypothetical protein